MLPVKVSREHALKNKNGTSGKASCRAAVCGAHLLSAAHIELQGSIVFGSIWIAV